MSNIGIIIEREYLERVKKKSFIITTLLMPLLMIVLMVLPVILMEWVGGSSSRILVVDRSGEIMPMLTDSESVSFIPATPDVTIDSALHVQDVDAVLIIPENVISSRKSNLRLYSNGPSSVTTESIITDKIDKIIEGKRLEQYDIPDLNRILEDIDAQVSLTTVRNDEEDAPEAMSSMLSYGLGLGMAFILYMFLLLYGQMVMTSIIEEKSNRVLELMVSSVTPMQLMMGKITGVALVALTQIVLWGILLSIMSGIVLPAIIPAETMAEIASMRSGQLDALGSESGEMIAAMSMLTQVGTIIGFISLMTIFLILGFLIYASIFAAAGSAVDNIQDASQLTTFAVIPIVLGVIFATTAAADPMGPLAFWTSLFPLTAPMVMVARIPFGIPGWQIILSMVLQLFTFLGLVWMAGKIYRVGIFMYGKKPSIKEIIRWTTYK